MERRDFLKFGLAAAGMGVMAVLPSAAQAQERWQPRWNEITDWPAGPGGERQTVTVPVSSGEVVALSCGYIKFFDSSDTPHLYEAAAASEVVIPILDGGEHGGVFKMELNNLYNWKGSAEKPINGRFLSLQEMEMVVLDRVRSAKMFNGATSAIWLWINASAPRWLIGETKIHDIDTFLGFLDTHTKGTCYQVFLPQVGW